MTKNKKTNETFDWDIYHETRNSFDQIRVSQLNAFDKAILAISSSALGFSLYFINVLPKGVPITGTFSLVLCWFSFGIAISINLLSYLSGSLSASADIKNLDSFARKNKPVKFKKNVFTKITEAANIFALGFFMLGMLCFFIFAYSNTQIGLRNV